MKKHEGLYPCSECDGEGKTPSTSCINWKNYTGEYEKYKKELEDSVEICGVCSGEGERFYDDEEQYFNKLADRFERDTSVYSFVCKDHPCYITMKKMGERAIPFLLRKMRKEITWLMSVLWEVVKKEDWPEVLEENRGKIKELTEMWLKWGKEKGYIDG